MKVKVVRGEREILQAIRCRQHDVVVLDHPDPQTQQPTKVYVVNKELAPGIRTMLKWTERPVGTHSSFNLFLTADRATSIHEALGSIEEVETVEL